MNQVADLELAAKIDFSESTVTAGKTSEVVARCKSIHAAAAEKIDTLGKYGITNAKLAVFKKCIEAFDRMKSAPRQGQVTRSAATQLVPHLVRSAVATVRYQLDGLIVQFEEANPDFVTEYNAARRVVENRGGRNVEAIEKGSSVPDSNNESPVSKAA